MRENLNNFGLEFGYTENGISGDIPISSTHAIFENVDYLYQNNGNDALNISTTTTDPKSQVLVSYNGHGLYAVYDSESVPEPALMSLLFFGVSGLTASWLFRKKRQNR